MNNQKRVSQKLDEQKTLSREWSDAPKTAEKLKRMIMGKSSSAVASRNMLLNVDNGR